MAQAQSATRMVLAERLIPGEGLLWEAARILSANVLLVLCAQIAVPLPWTQVPVTGQTFGVLLVAVLLGARRGALALGLYLLEGAAGWPVFAPFGLPGAARLLGPTAGYLWAFPVAAFVTGWLAERIESFSSWSGKARLAGAVLVGHAVILSGGVMWLASVMAMGAAAALAQGLAPFVLLDVPVKTALVVAAARGMDRVKHPA
ncbi:MAG: biotin transporter BioY [Acidobacteria bacterium]|nr:biotin transporter BioY [Acidobacteriota bacterium]